MASLQDGPDGHPSYLVRFLEELIDDGEAVLDEWTDDEGRQQVDEPVVVRARRRCVQADRVLDQELGGEA